MVKKSMTYRKILSALMALLLLLTALPVSAVAYSTGDDIATVQAAITAYETKMDGTVYTNMQAAYDAYIAAKEALDAYQYGDVTSLDLAQAASALTAATDNMQAWTAYTAAGVPTVAGTQVGSDYYSNVLYSYGSATDFSTGVKMTYQTGPLIYACYWYLYYPETVLLYDGTNEASFPVMSGFKDTDKNYDFYPVGLYTTEDDLSLADYWYGYSDGFSWNTATNYQLGYQAGSYIGTMKADNTSTVRSYSNKLIYTGTPSGYSTSVSSTGWTGYGSTKSNSSVTSSISGNSGSSSGTFTETTVYVVNYAPLKNLLESGDYASLLKNASEYDCNAGAYSNILAALDQGTGLDPNNYSYSSVASAATNDCAAEIEDAVKAIQAIAAPATDGDGYDALRSAITTSYSAAAAGGSGYTEETWDPFIEAYNNAVVIMAAVTDGYSNESGAAAAAETLVNAYNALQTKVSKVDTTELEAAIDAAESLSSYVSYFTESTWSALMNAVASAKEAVWGSVDSYRDASSALDLSDGNQAAVDAWTETVNSLISALRINHDAAVLIGGAAVSYNSLIAAADALDASQYANYTDVISAVADAQISMAALDDQAFTTAEDLIGAYTEILQSIYDALASLEYAFTMIPDGTVAAESEAYTVGSASSTSSTNSMIDTTDLSGRMALGFDFPTGAVIFRTTHAASTYTLGKLVLRWGGYPNYEESLLFINLVDTNTTTGEIWTKQTTSDASGVPDTVSSYSAGVSFSSGTITYKLQNLYCVEQNSNYASGFAVDADGNHITDESTDLVGLISSTDTSDAGNTNCLVVKGGGNSKWGGNTYSGDFSLSVPKTSASALSASTLPSSTVYELSQTVGVVSRDKYAPLLTYQVVRHDVADYSISTTIVDISYLFDLIAVCEEITDSRIYTPDSWSAFSEALTAAKNSMAYTTMAADEITSACQTRYTDLWNAYQGLELNTFTLTFQYSDVSGAEQTSTFTAYYGDTVSTYADQVSVSDYTLNGYTYTFTGWDPAITNNTLVLEDAVYTAQYSVTQNPADFTAYDQAVSALLSVPDDTYSVSDLEALAGFIADLTYYNMDQESRDALMSDVQDAIDAETAQIASYADTNMTEVLDVSVLEAALELYKSKYDSDAYDLSALELYQSVSITDGVIVSGLVYTTQAEVDAVITELLTNCSKMCYTVSLNGTLLGTYEYGEKITVNSEDGSEVQWYYSFDSTQVTQTTSPKFLGTGARYTFTVKGNTYLTTTASSDSEYLVTYARTFDDCANAAPYGVAYTTGSLTLPEAPGYAFYSFQEYQVNGVAYAAGATVTITEDTTVYAVYTPTTEGYEVLICDVDGNEIIDDTYQYNTLLTATDENAYGWTIGIVDYSAYNEYVIGYGSTITIRVSGDMEIWAYTEEDLFDVAMGYDDNYVSSTVKREIVYSDAKFSMVGAYAVPDGIDVLEYGILFDYKAGNSYNWKTLTVENASNDSDIYRLKCTSHTEGNQYTASVKSTSLSGQYAFEYCAYVIYEKDGERYTAYSDTVMERHTF